MELCQDRNDKRNDNWAFLNTSFVVQWKIPKSDKYKESLQDQIQGRTTFFSQQ